MTVFTTACPRNCYSTCCMRVHVETGEIRRIEPHPDNRATPEGVCLKGLSYVERVRLARPHPVSAAAPARTAAVRADPLGRGARRDRRAPAANPRRVRAAERAVLRGERHQGTAEPGRHRASGGSTAAARRPTATSAGRPGSRPRASRSATTSTTRRGTSPTRGSIVLWGKNAGRDQHPPDAVRRAGAGEPAPGSSSSIRAAPQTAERADCSIRPRPGTDGALALAVAHVLSRARLDVDRDFVARTCWASTSSPQLVRDVHAGVGGGRSPRCRPSRSGSSPSWIGTGRRSRSAPASACSATRTAARRCGRSSRCSRSPATSAGPGAGWVFANLQSHIFDEVKDPVAFYPARDAGRRGARVDLDRAARPGHAGAARPAAAHGLGRARQPGHAEPRDERRARGVPRARVPRRRRPVPDRHRARGGHRAAGQDDVRAVGRDRRLLASLHPAQAEGARAAGRGEAGVGDLLAARARGSASRGGRDPRPRSPSRRTRRSRRSCERRLAPFDGLTLERLREGPQFCRRGTRRSPSPTSCSRRRRARSSCGPRRRRARWGVDPLPAYVEPEESVRRDAPRGPAVPALLHDAEHEEPHPLAVQQPRR